MGKAKRERALGENEARAVVRHLRVSPQKLNLVAQMIRGKKVDVALADLLPTKQQQDWYFGNLDVRRVTWSIGRDLTLAPPQDAGPVNAMHKVYVELDGKPHAAWDRKLTFRSLAAP